MYSAVALATGPEQFGPFCCPAHPSKDRENEINRNRPEASLAEIGVNSIRLVAQRTEMPVAQGDLLKLLYITIVFSVAEISQTEFVIFAIHGKPVTSAKRILPLRYPF
jgi:hypothetical protein